MLLHEFAGTVGETEQHIHGLELELDRGPVARDPIQARFDEPFTDAKLSLNLLSALDLCGHSVTIIRTPSKSRKVSRGRKSLHFERGI